MMKWAAAIVVFWVTGAGVVAFQIEAPTTNMLVGQQVPFAVAGAKGSVRWATTAQAIASVSSTGVVKGIAPGQATITARSGNLSAAQGVVIRNSNDTDTGQPGCNVTAASTSQAAIQSAIDTATSGQVVCVPSGSSTLTTALTITGKALTLRGAGIGVTTITDNTTAGQGVLSISASATNFVSVTGFTFVKQHANSNGMVQITATSRQVGFRFHHNRLFDNGVAGGRGIYVYSGYGLIDHVTFDVTDTTASDQMVSIEGTPGNTDGGHTAWTWALASGTDQAVYVEDCTFTIANQHEDVIDMYGGARVVVRHSAFSGTSVGLHGTDSGAIRSPVLAEMYANTFTNSSGVGRRAITTRGGTGVYFDNTFSGSTTWSDFTLLLYRATILDVYGWQMCDGTLYDLGSAVLSSDASRTTVTYNTVARFLASSPDTICTGAGDCSRAFDGSGTRGYPCRDQPGRGPGQALEPIYAWNNGSIPMSPYDGGCTGCGGGSTVATWLLENRDYYNYVSSGFDGTVGVGRGTLASRPATCAPLTAYFATDSGSQGTLYQCAVTNTWSSYYVPYTYPHPLTSGA